MLSLTPNTCETCENNFKGICAGNDLYGKPIDNNLHPECWGMSVEYQEKLLEELPERERELVTIGCYELEKTIIKFR
ncbi:hypothetical protein LIT25_11375 [Bacillus sp. F19]|nr:hypothetical protein LIT25_11375 [Bacillus sp. F19]